MQNFCIMAIAVYANLKQSARIDFQKHGNQFKYNTSNVIS